MIELYPLLAVPLALVVRALVGARSIIKWSAAVLAGFLIWLNIFQTFQFEAGSLHYDAMTARLYVKQFGQLKKVQDFDSLLDYPDYDRARATGR